MRSRTCSKVLLLSLAVSCLSSAGVQGQLPGQTSVTNSIGITTASPPPPDPTTTTTTTSGAATTTPSPPPPDPNLGAGAATTFSSNAGQTVNTVLGASPSPPPPDPTAGTTPSPPPPGTTVATCPYGTQITDISLCASTTSLNGLAVTCTQVGVPNPACCCVSSSLASPPPPGTTASPPPATPSPPPPGVVSTAAAGVNNLLNPSPPPPAASPPPGTPASPPPPSLVASAGATLNGVLNPSPPPPGTPPASPPPPGVVTSTLLAANTAATGTTNTVGNTFTGAAAGATNTAGSATTAVTGAATQTGNGAATTATQTANGVTTTTTRAVSNLVATTQGTVGSTVAVLPPANIAATVLGSCPGSQVAHPVTDLSTCASLTGLSNLGVCATVLNTCCCDPTATAPPAAPTTAPPASACGAGLTPQALPVGLTSCASLALAVPDLGVCADVNGGCCCSGQAAGAPAAAPPPPGTPPLAPGTCPAGTAVDTRPAAGLGVCTDLTVLSGSLASVCAEVSGTCCCSVPGGSTNTPPPPPGAPAGSCPAGQTLNARALLPGLTCADLSVPVGSNPSVCADVGGSCCCSSGSAVTPPGPPVQGNCPTGQLTVNALGGAVCATLSNTGGFGACVLNGADCCCQSTSSVTPTPSPPGTCPDGRFAITLTTGLVCAAASIGNNGLCTDVNGNCCCTGTGTPPGSAPSPAGTCPSGTTADPRPTLLPGLACSSLTVNSATELSVCADVGGTCCCGNPAGPPGSSPSAPTPTGTCPAGSVPNTRPGVLCADLTLLGPNPSICATVGGVCCCGGAPGPALPPGSASPPGSPGSGPTPPGAPGSGPTPPGTPGSPGSGPTPPGTPGSPGSGPTPPGTPGSPGSGPTPPGSPGSGPTPPGSGTAPGSGPAAGPAPGTPGGPGGPGGPPAGNGTPYGPGGPGGPNGPPASPGTPGGPGGPGGPPAAPGTPLGPGGPGGPGGPPIDPGTATLASDAGVNLGSGSGSSGSGSGSGDGSSGSGSGGSGSGGSGSGGSGSGSGGSGSGSGGSGSGSGGSGSGSGSGGSGSGSGSGGSGSGSGSGGSGSGSGGSGSGSGSGSEAGPASGPGAATTLAGCLTSGACSDRDVLTFALNQECLEGQFYSCAATGQPLDSSLTRNGPAPTSCVKANISSGTQAVAQELMREEVAHITALNNQLRSIGESPSCPLINLDSSFEQAVAASTNSSGSNTTFDSRADDPSFLAAASFLEDVRASTLLGAIQAYQDSGLKLLAAQIGEAEAAHSTIVRLSSYQASNATTALGNTLGELTNDMSNFRNTLTGTQVFTPTTNANGIGISNVNSEGKVSILTLPQAASIYVLGQANLTGGFFPDGLTGSV